MEEDSDLWIFLWNLFINEQIWGQWFLRQLGRSIFFSCKYFQGIFAAKPEKLQLDIGHC